MPRADPVLIFDLDGTILRCNSFPHWVMGLMAGSHGRGGLPARVRLSWKVQQLLVRRKLRRLGHDAFLHALQRLWAESDAAAGPGARRFQAQLLRKVRPNLVPLLRSVADGSVDAVLATAAAGEYAEPLAQELGFRHVLATPSGGGAPCNRGAEKLARVEAFLRERDWAERPRIFFNDHMDDLALMQASQAVCWFGNGAALKAAQAAAPEVRFVPCTGLRVEEIRQLLAHLRQSLEAAQLVKTVSFDWSGPRIRTFS